MLKQFVICIFLIIMMSIPVSAAGIENIKLSKDVFFPGDPIKLTFFVPEKTNKISIFFNGKKN